MEDYSDKLEYLRIRNAASVLLDSLFYGKGVLFGGYLQGKEGAIIDCAIKVVEDMEPLDDSHSLDARKDREELIKKRPRVLENLKALKKQFSE